MVYFMNDEKVKEFFVTGFKRQPKENESYFKEWVHRFESPRRVWSFSDYDRRKVLKKMFPKKFGKLKKDANLNNPEYQTEEFDEW